MGKVKRVSHFFNWNDCLKELVEDGIVGTSYNRYLRFLVIRDLEERFKNSNDRFDKYTILSTLHTLYSEEKIDKYKNLKRIEEIKPILKKLKGRIRKGNFIMVD